MNFIFTKKNYFDSSLCDKLIDIFDKNTNRHFKGTIGSDLRVNLEVKNCDEMLSEEKLENEIINKIKPCINEYLNKHQLSGNFLFEKTRIKRYLNTEKYFFKKHTDISSIKTAKRMLAIIIYLNTVDEGGETIIYLDKQRVKVKPEKGKILIFPANFCYPHEGVSPISNNKYILVTFLKYD